MTRSPKLTTLLLVASLYVYAAEPALDKRIPAGYQLIEKACGDLNGDGADDCVLTIIGAKQQSKTPYYCGKSSIGKLI